MYLPHVHLPGVELRLQTKRCRKPLWYSTCKNLQCRNTDDDYDDDGDDDDDDDGDDDDDDDDGDDDDDDDDDDDECDDDDDDDRKDVDFAKGMYFAEHMYKEKHKEPRIVSIHGTGEVVRVVFKSDPWVTRRGFFAHYSMGQGE